MQAGEYCFSVSQFLLRGAASRFQWGVAQPGIDDCAACSESLLANVPSQEMGIVAALLDSSQEIRQIGSQLPFAPQVSGSLSKHCGVDIFAHRRGLRCNCATMATIRLPAVEGHTLMVLACRRKREASEVASSV